MRGSLGLSFESPDGLTSPLRIRVCARPDFLAKEIAFSIFGILARIDFNECNSDEAQSRYPDCAGSSCSRNVKERVISRALQCKQQRRQHPDHGLQNSSLRAG